MFKKGLFCVFMFFTVFCKAQTSEAIQQVWEEVSCAEGTNLIPRHEAAFVAVGDKFFLLGGRGIKPISIFDVKTSIWTEGQKPPIELHHFQPVVYENKVYVIGALTGKYPAETPVEHIYSYDPQTDHWEKVAAIPNDRQRGSTGNVVVKDKVYIFCGIKDGHRGDHKKWTDSYDFKTRKWEIYVDAPESRDHFQAAVIDQKVYLVGGRLSKAPDKTFSETISTIDVFDLQLESWEDSTLKIPTQRAGNMVFPLGKRIFVIGGESITQEKAHAEVEVLDVESHVWETYPKLIHGRHGTGIVFYNNALYLASGSGKRGGSPELQSMEKLIINKD
ncbi:Kelch repeat-containing protein [Namhaeicola litoreus]|uniref:Kelch repeat-containing protein n=1 Tax=Namhaeicola litoreus TaxID=1052145 RepID=A0ABW3XZ57_9FLAO